MQTSQPGVIDPLFALERAPDESLDAALARALAELDRFGVAQAGIGVDAEPALARAALAAHPGRFFARTEADPRRGMDELRRIERLARELPLRAVTLSPAHLRLPLDDARCYPLYARCVELGLALVASVGVPAERVPFAPQKLERVDPVACHFPELRLVLRDGAEPWQALAVLLLRRHPNLSYAANLPPREVPREILAFANDDGAHQLLFASGPARERSFKELADLELARPVWPRFLRDNAVRVFRL